MGDEEFNEEDIDWDASGADEPKTPAFRATITRNSLRVATWLDFLVPSGGPASNLFRPVEANGVTIADLYVEDGENGRELTVAYLADGAGGAGERRLARWAAQLGYARIWFPDRLEELEPRPAGRARVECPGCGFVWRDSSPEFWTVSFTGGRFPSVCPLCCNDLPQWTVTHKRRREHVSEPQGVAGGARPRSPERRGT